MRNYSGKLITFEGLDKCGKSVQIKLLYDKLLSEGYDVIKCREPGGTALGEKIRELLLHKKELHIHSKSELMLFMTARTELVEEVLKPSLNKSKIVLMDRFYDSSFAYQGYGRGIEKINSIVDFVLGLDENSKVVLAPDLTFLLDVTVDESIKRRMRETPDRMESAGVKFFEDVRNGYLKMAASEPYRFRVIDGMRSIEDIHKDILEETLKLLK